MQFNASPLVKHWKLACVPPCLFTTAKGTPQNPQLRLVLLRKDLLLQEHLWQQTQAPTTSVPSDPAPPTLSAMRLFRCLLSLSNPLLLLPLQPHPTRAAHSFYPCSAHAMLQAPRQHPHWEQVGKGKRIQLEIFIPSSREGCASPSPALSCSWVRCCSQLCTEATQHLLEAHLNFISWGSRAKALNLGYFPRVSWPSSRHNSPLAKVTLCLSFFSPQVLLLYVASGVPGALSQDLLGGFCACCNSAAVAGML